MTDTLRTLMLENGIRVDFFDQSNRYFGDFHRLCIQVVIHLPDDFDVPPGVDRDKVRLERTLEKMGVPTADVESARRSLIDSFLQSSRDYLSRAEFPVRLFAKAQQQKRKPVTQLFNR